METYFIGCLHLGHKWMAQHRGFQDDFYHDEHLIDNWNSIVGLRDTVIIVGDVTMEDPNPYRTLDRLYGKKIVILGNHDPYYEVKNLLKHVDYVAGSINYQGYEVTHIPIHPNEIGFCKGNIHAHIHHINKLDECIVSERYQDKPIKKISTLDKYYCVDAKLLDFKPKTLEQLLNK